MKLTREEKDLLAQKLSSPFGSVNLLCDGHKITLAVERSKGMTYRVMTYVDGYFKGVWMNPENNAPESKFLRKSVTPIISPAQKREDEKALGKRWVKSRPIYQQTSTFYMPDWASGKAALAHLCKVCESVQIAE